MNGKAKHAAARRLLQAAADGSLSAAERAWLNEHLAGCAECRLYQADLIRLQAALVHALRARRARPAGQAALPDGIVAQAQRKARLNRLLRAANKFTQAASVLVIALLFANLVRLREFAAAPPTPQARPAAAVNAAPAAAPDALAVQFPAIEFEAEPSVPVAPVEADDPAQAWIVAGRLMAR